MPEDEAGCLFELDPGEDVVLVAFGGLVAWDLVGYGDGPSTGSTPAGPVQAPFEFFNLVSGEPVGKVFVRDLDQAFYQHGVRGLGTSIREVAGALGDLVGPRERTVFVGQSAGGFAAMLFGGLLGATRVLAFSPQSFLSPWWRRRHHDDRWPQEVARARRAAGLRMRHLDVRPALRSARGRVAVDIYYGGYNRLDGVHAHHVAGLPNVRLHPVATPSHGVARRMREDGSLRSVLGDAVGLPRDRG